jgi:hypothetical protein
LYIIYNFLAFSRGWFIDFLPRYNITLRLITNKGPKVRAHYKRMILSWLQCGESPVPKTSYEKATDF